MAVDFEKVNNVILFEIPALKTVIVKDKEINNKQIFYNLTLLQKLKFFSIKNKSDRIILSEKGIMNNSRILIYGTIKYENKNYSILPKFLIGSGIVEFEECVENITNNINLNLHKWLVFLFFLSLIHILYKIFLKLKK